MDILKETGSEVSPDVFSLPPILLDDLFKDMPEKTVRGWLLCTAISQEKFIFFLTNRKKCVIILKNKDKQGVYR